MNDVNTGEMQDPKPFDKEELDRERDEVLHRLEDWLETPMLVLAFVWLALLVMELTWGKSQLFEITGTVIWIIFLLDFAVKFALAPHKIAFLKRNWLTSAALLVPALRIFRIFRVIRLFRFARLGRGVRLLRIISSLNRGMAALGASLSRRGFGYVAGLTVLVTFAGAAGMYAFEKEIPSGLNSYGEALWWTAMVMTTMGSQYWPTTLEGRLLCIFLALYAFAIFGYVTAAIATFFVGRDAENSQAELAGGKQLDALRRQVIGMRDELRALSGSEGPPES